MPKCGDISKAITQPYMNLIKQERLKINELKFPLMIRGGKNKPKESGKKGLIKDEQK